MTAFTEPLLRFYMWSCGYEVRKLSLIHGWLFELWAVKTGEVFSSDLRNHTGSDVDFLSEAYREGMRREIDPIGLAGFSDDLRRGGDRMSVLRTLFASEECQARFPATAPTFPSTLDPVTAFR